jgi:hypothetical protein
MVRWQAEALPRPQPPQPPTVSRRRPRIHPRQRLSWPRIGIQHARTGRRRRTFVAALTPKCWSALSNNGLELPNGPPGSILPAAIPCAPPDPAGGRGSPRLAALAGARRLRPLN